jgi:DNA-binding beta-propeller fold protein YncE
VRRVGGGRDRALGTLSRIGAAAIAFASLSSFISSSAAPAAGGSTPPGAALLSFLKPLAGPQEAPMYPSGLIWDPTFPGSSGGAVIVADTGYNRITVFDPTACPNPDTSTCAPILSFGTFGSANGQFNTPRDVAVDAAHNIYVADAANNRVEAFNANGTWLWSAADTADCHGKAVCVVHTPIGISYDPTDNEILVADTGHSLVKAYAAVGGVPVSGGLGPFAAGAYIWDSPAGVVKSPREARRGPDGEIWVADYNDERIVAFQCTCTTSSTSWNNTPNKVIGDGQKMGHGNGQVNSPYNIAFSPDGKTGYVSDTGNERIGVFSVTTCTGTLNGVANECPFVANIGARCPTPCPEPPGNASYFNALRRVSVDPATGDIWSADFWGSGLHEFGPTPVSGQYPPLTEIDGSPAPPAGFAESYGVSVGPDGTTYVADRLNQRIDEFAADGTYITDQGQRGVAAGQYSWPEAVAVAPDKTVWIGDTRNGRLQQFANADLTGKPAIIGTKGAGLGQFNYIEGVSAAANGVLWVADTDNNRVESYNPATAAFAVFGTKGSAPGTSQMLLPESVVASATDMYVADTGNNRIVELTLGGAYVASYTGLDAPQGIALSPDGTLWVANTGTAQTDANGNDILHLSSLLTLLPGGFGGPGTSNMQFFEPHSLAVSPDGTTLFIADTYNNRVQEYSIATQLAFTTSAGGANVGEHLSPQPVVTVQDDTGNTVASDTGTITLALTPGTGPSSAKLTCNGGLSAAEVGGVAAFGGCSVDTAGTYTLTATDGTLPATTSASFTVGTVGPASQLVFTTEPGGAPQGAPLNPQPVVTIEDASGNTIVGDSSTSVTLSITPNSGPNGATLGCPDPNGLTVQAVNGVATFGGCSIDTPGHGYTLTATDTADGLSTASDSFNIAIATGPAIQVAFTTEPGGAAPGAALSPQPVVAVEDAGGNTVTTDNSTVTLAITGGTGATLTCAGGQPPTASAVNGVASFSACRINDAGTGYTLMATDGTLTSAASDPFDIAVGGPTQLVFTTSPGGAAPAAPLNPQPVVTIEDAGGNVVTDDSSDVTLSITSGTGNPSASLTCSGSTLTAGAVNGVATFSGCSINDAGSGYTLTATDVADSLPMATSSSFNITSTFSLNPVYQSQISNLNGTASIYPQGGVEDMQGNIFLADSGNSEIWERTSAGVMQVIVPKTYGLINPRGLALDPGGSDIWVADTQNNRLIEFDLNGNYVATLGGGTKSGGSLSSPYGVVLDATNAYVANTYGYDVVALNRATGKSAWTTTSASPVSAGNGCNGSALTRVRGIGWGPDGNLYVADTDNNRVVVLSTAGNCVRVFGHGGSGNGQFKQPRDVIADPSSNGVWVADSGNYRLEHLSTTGSFISATTPAHGSMPGQFASVLSMFAYNSGIAVTDTYNYQVELFTITAGNAVEPPSILVPGVGPANGGFNGAWSVAYDLNGNLYATDYLNDRVEKFDPSGNFVCQFGMYGNGVGSLEFPRGVAVSANGNSVAVTQENNSVQLFSGATCKSTGQITVAGSSPSGLKRPRQVSFDPSNDGSVWIADYNNNRVLHVNSSGTVLLTITDGGAMKTPQGVVVDSSGDVFVSDTGNNAIEEYNSTSGTLIATLATVGTGPGQVKTPSELALAGPAGHQVLLIADTGNNRIVALQTNGTPAFTFGSAGNGAGHFTTPESVAYNPATQAIAVADFANSRVSLWGQTAQYVMSPSPIAPKGTLSSGQVLITVTAETSGGTPTPNVVVFLSFNPTAGGGTAQVGSTALSSTPQAFTADGNGNVTVTYTVPGSPPGSGSDTLTAQNAGTSPTITQSDSYAFS